MTLISCMVVGYALFLHALYTVSECGDIASFIVVWVLSEPSLR